MKRINKEKLPEVLTEEIVNVLVEMAMEFPQTKEWHEVFDLLDKRGQLMIVLDKVRIIKKGVEKAKEDAKSEEQKQAEEQQKQEFFKNIDPAKFYGNMGEPETPQQYKGKYGVWPPGYDEHGNKIN